MKGNENNVTITIFNLVSNGRYFLNLNDAALVWIKVKFLNDIIYFGHMLGVKEMEVHKNVRHCICEYLIVLFFKRQQPFLEPSNANDVKVSILYL
jgi:hypothetical protein